MKDHTTIELTGGIRHIADLADGDAWIHSLKATNVTFVGPAVLAIQGNVQISGNCSIEDGGGGPEAVVWEIDPIRRIVVGAIGLGDCSFTDCQFFQIGFAGTPDAVRSFFENVTVTQSVPNPEQPESDQGNTH